MPFKRLGIVLVAAALSTLIGCGEEESDKSLTEIAAGQRRHEVEISRISGRLGSIEGRLDEVRDLFRIAARDAPSGVVKFKDSPEYKQLAAALSDIRQKLKLAKSGVEKTKKETEREGLTYPEKLTKRLDALVESFGQNIEDPVRRREFQADVGRLKWINSDEVTSEEFREWLISDLKPRLKDPRYQHLWYGMGRGLKWLESGGDFERVRHICRDLETVLHLGDMIEKHSIPTEALNDVGLPRVWRGTTSTVGAKVD